MSFNEDSRVKIPAILHVCKLGYKYLSLTKEKHKIDKDTNIFTDIFFKSIKNINPKISNEDIQKKLEEISLVLDYEDLGKTFYQILTSSSDIKIIDFEKFDENTFNVVTELTFKNGEDEFRPDITLLINGIPLFIIEVKKPNNKEGIIAERDRINIRFKNKKFRKFINLLQILVYSNNMEYDDLSTEPLQGAFYSTTSSSKVKFNYFREENDNLLNEVPNIPDEIENYVLQDNNLLSIKHSPEFKTNKKTNSPTNKILTSLFSKNRASFLLKYGLVYIKSFEGIEKHVMRYPQFFATDSIKNKIEKGDKKGIIWHTQGSGKTALSYFNVKYLTDFFQKKNIISKFYFIVDRIDLAKQAKSEFISRDLTVHTVNSKEELLKDFKKKVATHNFRGKKEITVVNIQKFKDDNEIITDISYDTKVQRVYFLDEVHRSYNPSGSFLANLVNSDRDAILIGLTGTPLIQQDRKSRDIFGPYIHKYYYNDSIKDGYTLKLIREEIDTNYKKQLNNILNELVLKGDIKKRELYSHDKFVDKLIEFIFDDIKSSRIKFGDDTFGSMVVCDSSDQAKNLYSHYLKKYKNTNLKAELILHDVGDKDEREDITDNFKQGKIDILFVYNMLLTGFDANRLKKIYVGRIIKDHNLLQMLTRVNRPYKDYKYGFVVDFADITKEFDKTNRAYFEELKSELGDEISSFSNLFESKEFLDNEIKNIKNKLLYYDLNNQEIFSQQISKISDKETILEIKKALESSKNLYNLIRLSGEKDLIELLDFKKLHQLYNEVSRHLDLINLRESLARKNDNSYLLNSALENIVFLFKKIGQEELVIADNLRNKLEETRKNLKKNLDKKDPEYVTLYEELKRLFQSKNLEEISQEQMKKNIELLEIISNKANTLSQKNDLIKNKYLNDPKYLRVHKRIVEKNIFKDEGLVFEALNTIKKNLDDQVLKNNQIINNEGYFEQVSMPLVIDSFNKNNQLNIDVKTSGFINNLITNEYISEFNDL